MTATRADDTNWTLNFPRHGLRGPEFRELWRGRELAYFLALRDVKIGSLQPTGRATGLPRLPICREPQGAGRSAGGR